MKLLYIMSNTDSDFAAQTFEESKFNTDKEKLKLWKKAEKSSGATLLKIKKKDLIDPTYVNEDANGKFEEEIQVHSFEFDKVDPNFIQFIRDRMIDYDYSKSHDFFIVEE